SYTSNFPYDPLAGNHPTGGAVLYSAISFVFLLAGTALVLFAFGRFDYLGWHRSEAWPPHTAAVPTTDAQRATLKFMAVAPLLFLGQPLIGGGIAHYRADPGSFYGIDLSVFLPSNLLRTWHLQLAIFWIASAYVAGALFVAGMLGRGSPPGQRRATDLLFVAILIVAVGRLFGEWGGLRQWLGPVVFGIRDPGLELSR